MDNRLLISKKQWPKWVLYVCRFLFGATFMFSGFVKAIDPLGSTYKIQDYLAAWGLSGVYTVALVGAIALAAIEFMIGVTVFFGIRLRETSILALLFMLFMTPLTLWIALTNPVTDCGCFGDAIILTNWETFGKNIVLLSLALIMVWLNKIHRPRLTPLPEWLLLAFAVLVSTAFSVFCLKHLPLIDFRPYKIGNNIAELMVVPEGAKTDRYQTTFIYEKEGVQQEFTLENYPWNDSTWKFVDQKSILIEKGFVPPIHDFAIMDEQNNDLTEEVLSYPGKTYLVVMYDLTLTDLNEMSKLTDLYNKTLREGDRFYALTASSREDVSHFVNETMVMFPFYKMDPITLKTMIRANPGVILLQEGTIVDKWALRSR